MTIEEKISEVINNYVSSNGTGSKMTTDELYSLVIAKYNMNMNRNSFLPADYCYNRTNEGINFEKHSHLFERTDDGYYLVLGEHYPYSGHVYYRRKGETVDNLRGVWNNGIYEEVAEVVDIFNLRLNNLFYGVKNALKEFSVHVTNYNNVVEVKRQEFLICGISVDEKVYKIFYVNTEWSHKTSYHCDSASDGTWFYYLETIDECIGEVQRFVMFKAQTANEKLSVKV